MKQLSFFNRKAQFEFGGTLSVGKRKSLRPLDTKRAHHFVLKTRCSNRLLRNRRRIEQITRHTSRRFGVKIYSMAVQTDHVHLNVRLSSRLLYKRWIRALSSRLVIAVKGLKFVLRPYSRIVSWGRQFKSLCGYIAGNLREANFILDNHEAVDAFAIRWENAFSSKMSNSTLPI